MTIEIHTPPNKVPAALITKVKRILVEFHQRNGNVSSVEVSFRESIEGRHNRVCDVRLAGRDHTVSVSRTARNFRDAADAAFYALGLMTPEREHKKTL
ncbi:MAG TPA: hypothetical protein VFZ78_09035 [Flavisolibacter sp.]